MGDISIYTNEDEVPLKEVMVAIKNKENGQKISIETMNKPEQLHKYFEEVLPNYDKERVYNHDIKKMISWYNLLIGAAVDFEQEEINAEAAE